MLTKRVRFSVSISSLVTLAMGLLITAILFVAVRRVETQRHRLEFQQAAQLRLLTVSEGVEDAVAALRSVNRLFDTMESVSREQFRYFVDPLLARYPYIQAFNFHRLLSGAERAPYESEMRRSFPDFNITELRNGELVTASPRPLYSVVDYLEPMQGNQKAFGFDALSYEFQKDALRRANATGLPAATGLLRLMQETGSQQGVIIIQPVYRAGVAQNDAGVRRQAVIGDTAAVFRVGDMLRLILASKGLLADPGLSVRLYASPTADAANLAFSHGESVPGDAGATHLIPAWLWLDDPGSVSGAIDMAGTAWHMVVSRQPVLFMENYKGSLYVLISGVLLSMLAAAYVYSLVSRESRIKLLVGERTSALQSANSRLIEDIARRAQTEETLRLHEKVIELSASAVIITSADAPDYVIQYVNSAFERITGYSAADVVGQPLRVLQGDERDQQNTEAIRAALIEKREGHAMLRAYRKDGTMYWNDLYIAPVRNEAGEVSHFVLAQYDISEAKRYEAELEFQANHDALTGLANRKLVRHRLDLAIANSLRFGHSIWILFVDIDRFSLINDTLGYAAGDQILRTIARRLEAAAHEVDIVGRLGGDEFALIVEGRFEQSIVDIVQRIVSTVGAPLTGTEPAIFLSCCVGVAVCPADDKDADTLIRYADTAMHRAKELGRNSFEFYTPLMNERTQERVRLERDLRSALERGEFVLHYQPQVDLTTGKIASMEALIRWQHPQLGLLAPDRFIGLAEDTGLIVPIGAWVVRTACAQTKAWQQEGLDDLRVAVNLSTRQFLQKDLVLSVGEVLEQTGLAPCFLEIELTESLVMTDVDHAIGILHDFRNLGVKLAVDDFGTGYSSLSYLKRLPLSVLKIDKAFVRDISLDPDDAAIVLSIISLAHTLRLHVIAEGVETLEQLAFLQRHGCDAIQGYYFSRPVPAEAFTQMLRDGKCLPANQHLEPASAAQRWS